MIGGFSLARVALALPLCGMASLAQVAVSGRVVDEDGAAVAGVRIDLRPVAGGVPLAASSDLAGIFIARLPAAGEYSIRAERQGFYLYQASSQSFAEGTSEFTITLNHVQEFSDRIDVTASPPAIDPSQP